ncbi:tape measure protein [Acinetobacter terrae]|uniref:Tape measure protein n=1 Tax=Acinetobacter terrae TaxID=2731247 RepID=A0ABX1V0U6_9GAMM|nr:tape measure protein [Acinetobacter terrae]NNH86256.1 tape measure protein [Acinetobacter terrae]
MSGKNLTFKLVMDADNKGLVSTAKNSETVMKAVFDSIKSESDKLKQASESASKEIGNIVPKGTTDLADKLTQSLSAATGIIKDAGDNAKSTASNFTDFGNKAEKALSQLKTDLTQAKQKLQEFSATNASPADIEKAKVQVDQLEKEVQQADQAFNNFHAEVGKANTKLNETDSAAQTAQKGISGLKTGYTALIGVMGGLGIGLGIRELAQTADSYTNLSARINIATKDGGDFTSAMAGVHQVALMTNSSLEATGSLFTRLNAVGKDMGITQQQALDLTKTVTQAIQIGGGSAQASEAAVQQFIQAMQGGVLRGEEFNSIMENGYGVAEALARGLGVTTGELRKMAENGELGAERVVKALQSQADQIQATYNKFPITIANALQRIATSWQIVIGEMDQANGASATVAGALVNIADNLGIIKVFLDDVGLGFASLVGDLQGGIDASTIDAFKSAISAAYDAVKDLVKVFYEFGTDVIDIVGTSLTGALSIFSSFTGGVSEAGGQVSFLERIFQGLGITFGFISDGLTAIGIVLKVATGNFFMLASAANSVMAALTWGDVSKQFAANADLMKDKAKQYYAEADQEAQEFQSKGLQRLNEAAQTQAEKDAESVESSRKKLEQLLAHQQTEVNGRKVTEAEKLSAVQTYAEAAIAANNGVMDGTMQADLLTKGYIVTIDQAGKVSVQAGESAAQAAENAKVKEEALKVAKDNVKKADEEYLAYQKQAAIERALLEKQIEEAKRTGDLNALSSAQSSLSAVNAKEAELAKNRELRITELNQLNSGAGQVVEGTTARARKAAVALGLDLDASLNKVSAKFKENGTNVDNFVAGLKGLGVTGKQAGDVTYEAWLKWMEQAKSQAEIDAAKAKLQEFGDQGKVSTSQVEQGLIAIKLQAQKLPDDIDPVTASFKALGIETRENLKLAAQKAVMDFINIRDSGKATAEGVQKAYEKMAGIVAASGDAGVIAAANSAGANRDLRIEVDATGKASVKSMDELTSANDRVRNSAERIGDGYRHAGKVAREEAKSSTEAWADAVNAASKNFDAEMKRQSKSLSKGIYDYSSYSKADVLSQLKGKGYSDKEAEKLAGSIWSEAMAADRSAKEQGLGKDGSLAVKALINAEFNNAASKGLTTQHGTNKINDLLNQMTASNLVSTGPSAKPVDVNSLAPTVSTPVASPTTTDASKAVNYNISFGGQTLSLSGSAEQESMMNQLISQLKTQAKST